jgi:hypothetical protein
MSGEAKPMTDEADLSAAIERLERYADFLEGKQQHSPYFTAEDAKLRAPDTRLLLSLVKPAIAQEEAGRVAAEAYQVIGALADRGGLFDDDETIRALDYFSAETQDGSILPFGWAADTLPRSSPPDAWRPIAEAKKDGSIIWAVFRDDIYPTIRPGRKDLERWNGIQVSLRHPGLAEDGFDIGWSVAAPVGNGGLPDEWIAGWLPLPAPPPTRGADE